MKIESLCMTCVQKNKAENVRKYLVEVTDGNIYKFKCDESHENTLIIQESKFELLFELGISSFVDGYYRESVANFASSLERLYEFYIKAIVLTRGIDESELSSTWKMVKSQSERQLGAVLFLSLIDNNICLQTLQGKYIELRNNVVHKGYFPSEEETIEYGEASLTIINEIVALLLSRYQDASRRLLTEPQKQYTGKEKENPYSIVSLPTLLGLSRPELLGKNNLRQMIEERRRKRLFL